MTHAKTQPEKYLKTIFMWYTPLMIIEKVELTNFRNHKDTALALSPGVNVLVGKNAQGKTNLLEAVVGGERTKIRR
jgi:DNA replication and repair protein RecF